MLIIIKIYVINYSNSILNLTWQFDMHFHNQFYIWINKKKKDNATESIQKIKIKRAAFAIRDSICIDYV